uniref:Hyaluronan/mRNA-binding protein domain-containing protein n=1 Tax=Ananas comosus var. bracteatus TaxID=296719 RepID=A0A6V7QQN7_ANACO
MPSGVHLGFQGDDDNDDPSQLIATQQQKIAAQQQKIAPKKPAAAAPAKLPSKPLPPQQAVREARDGEAPRRGGAGRGGPPQRGRGGRGGGIGSNRDFGQNDANGFPSNVGGGGGEDLDSSRPSERGRGGYRPSYRGGRRGGYGNREAEGDSEQPPRRMYERRSGTGRGYEVKRDGAGRGNWGTTNDDMIAQVNENVGINEKAVVPEKQSEQDGEPALDANKDKEGAENEDKEKEPEDKEMTLEEYEKIKEEKRKALLVMKAQERKVEFDKDFQSMKQLSIKKDNDDIFIKLGSDKDAGKKRDNDRDERVKKSLSINEFLKPGEGEEYYKPGGRGRGRGRGSFRGGFGGSNTSSHAAPAIEDPGQFPTLGGK